MRKLYLVIPMLLLACKGNVSITGDEMINTGNNTDGPNNSQVTDDGTVIVDGVEIDPARVTLHRLNRAEYNNTMRDLLGDTTQPANSFPDDDFGYGFNNIADVLTVSQLHLEFYNSAAMSLVDNALAGGGGADEETQRFEAEVIGSPVGVASGNEWNLFSNGTITTTVTFPADGDYEILVRARQQQAGAENAQMVVNIDNVPVQTFDVAPTTLTDFSVTTAVTGGVHSVSVEFTNDFFMAPDDRNLYVDYFEVTGPIGGIAGMPSGTRAEIMTCTPASAAEYDSCGREILTAFVSRAWRRPTTDEEITELMTLVDLAITEEDDFEKGIKLAMRGALLSPNFMFRVELDEDPTDNTPHPLTDYELASRLSYFLWSTMPDQELFDLAAAGELNNEETLRAQVDRMMNDEKAVALVDNMATQWLHIDSIEGAQPDYDLFPNWTEDFKNDMRTETRLFMEEVLSENLSIRDILLANFAHVNQDLAEHYGLPYSDNVFHRVEIPGEERRGFLTQGGFLTSTSRSTRTAPSLRGDWILKNILCEKPDDIPEGIEPIDEDPQPGLSLREQLEAHAENATCYSCHFEMDQFGLVFENYNAVGEWRDEDNGVPIDASGDIPGIGEFYGVFELTEILVDDPRYNDCLTKKFTTYALGRGIESWDQPQIDLIIENAIEQNLGIRDMFKEIVTSPAFRMRRGGDLPTADEE